MGERVAPLFRLLPWRYLRFAGFVEALARQTALFLLGTRALIRKLVRQAGEAAPEAEEKQEAIIARVEHEVATPDPTVQEPCTHQERCQFDDLCVCLGCWAF